MNAGFSRPARLALCLLVFMVGPRLWAQGPPFQTDDPVPVPLHRYEFYVFGGAASTPAETDATGPAFEFNWGAIPRVQLHALLPWVSTHPSSGPGAFGLGDMEVGAKIAYIKESKYIPQIGSFTMFELPTGDASRGLGVGKVWYKLPLWLQKNIGPWTLDGGAGETVVPQTGFRDFSYGGFLVKYRFGERLDLGGEVFSHGAATQQSEAATMIDAGGYYHFKGHPGEQFLFAYGHSIAGEAENYAYAGMYWTWGKDAASEDDGESGRSQPDAGSLWLPAPISAAESPPGTR